MTFEELKDFLVSQQKKLDKSFPIPDKEKAIFARMVKISEEVGELSEAVLSYFSLQREDKEKNGKEEVAGEIADVIISTMLLTVQMDIDLEKALGDKIEKLKNRKY